MLLQGALHGAESVSQELYASALKLADNRGLLATGSDETRLVFLAEIEDLVARVATIAELDGELLEEVLDDDGG
jgi:glycerol-3-phosphate O-acyltransferase